VAPVLTRGARSRVVLLPPGRWRAPDGAVSRGPTRIEVRAPLGELPVFERVP
jgi:alpha-glucosidase (family GH31 glycosyl hydrolase)